MSIARDRFVSYAQFVQKTIMLEADLHKNNKKILYILFYEENKAKVVHRRRRF